MARNDVFAGVQPHCVRAKNKDAGVRPYCACQKQHGQTTSAAYVTSLAVHAWARVQRMARDLMLTAPVAVPMVRFAAQGSSARIRAGTSKAVNLDELLLHDVVLDKKVGRVLSTIALQLNHFA